MQIKKASILGLCLTAAAFGFSANASAESGVKVGTLTCKPIQGTKVNLIIRSTVQVNCTYESGSVKEMYAGETGIGLGIDLSFKTDETIGWVVFAPSSDISPGNHALAGKYYGAKAEATAGVGVQANALIGGGDKSFTLQPLSLGGQTGFGAAGGLGYLYLEKAM